MRTVHAFSSNNHLRPSTSVRVTGGHGRGAWCHGPKTAPAQHRISPPSYLSSAQGRGQRHAAAYASHEPDTHTAQAASWQHQLRNTATAVALSAALLLGAVQPAVQPTFAAAPTLDPPTQQEASVDAQSPVSFLPNVSPLVPDKLKAEGADKLTDEYLTSDERATVALFERNTPSVVNITNLAEVQRNPYSMDVTTMPRGTGSGFVWDDKGHVVTNFHVVRGASAIRVTLYDSSSVSASVVGADENKDIAVLKLDVPDAKARQLKRVALGRSTGLAVGQRVFAIGNPFGLDHTLTSGIVSGLQREIQASQFGPKIKGVIQTDAAINPGNSGGMLLNSRGQLIGVNSAILDPSQRGAFSGVGFAIPIDMVKGLVEQILQFGRVIRPILGITMGPPQLISRLNIDGVLVYQAPDGSPAAAAGVRGCSRTANGDLALGDIITGMNGKRVKDYGDIFETLDDLKPGDKVELQLLRPSQNGSKMKVTVTLGERGSADG